MALNWEKWVQDTRDGMKTTPFCRYFLINGIVFVICITFVGLGFFLLWLAVPRLLLALTPFSNWAGEILGRLGLSVPDVRELKRRGRFWLGYFVAIRLVVATVYLFGGSLLVAKANISLTGLLFHSALSR